MLFDSTMMGLVLPSLIPRKYTHIFGGILFLYFGIKLLVDSRSMEDKVSEELEEVEEELAEMNKKQAKSKKKKELVNETSSVDDDAEGQNDVESLEAGGERNGDGAKQRRGGGNKNLKRAPSSGISAAGGYSGASWEGVFIQSLTLTFLAEWGDRSQIATIALAAAKDPVGVTIGGCVGHSICTGMAVVGGRMLASRISEKSVAFYDGLVFLVFGMHSLFFEE
jgi:putative Ca2+/H+ antiporter (TMEM165/GDT1 family)